VITSLDFEVPGFLFLKNQVIYSQLLAGKFDYIITDTKNGHEYSVRKSTLAGSIKCVSKLPLKAVEE
jgi:hypothetical protein